VRIGVVAATLFVAFATGTLAAATATRLGLPLKPSPGCALRAAVRFDYTSLDPSTNMLWIAHMNAANCSPSTCDRKIVKTISAPSPWRHRRATARPVFASATDAIRS